MHFSGGDVIYFLTRMSFCQKAAAFNSTETNGFTISEIPSTLCSVCLEPLGAFSFRACLECKSLVHDKCNTGPILNQFFCSGCHYLRDKMPSPDIRGQFNRKCELCPSRTGVMYPVFGNSKGAVWFAHPPCLWYVEELRKVLDPKSNSAACRSSLLELISTERSKSSCEDCFSERPGSVIQCDCFDSRGKRCDSFFHPICGAANGAVLCYGKGVARCQKHAEQLVCTAVVLRESGSAAAPKRKHSSLPPSSEEKELWNLDDLVEDALAPYRNHLYMVLACVEKRAREAEAAKKKSEQETAVASAASRQFEQEADQERGKRIKAEAEVKELCLAFTALENIVKRCQITL